MSIKIRQTLYQYIHDVNMESVDFISYFIYYLINKLSPYHFNRGTLFMVYVKRRTKQIGHLSVPEIKIKVRIPLASGECYFYRFGGLCSYKEHIALSFRKAPMEEKALVAIHYGCFRHNALELKPCSCSTSLWETIQYCSDHHGILLYSGVDCYEEPAQPDSYNYQSVAQMLLLMDIKTVRLFTPDVRQIYLLQEQGIEVEIEL